MRNKILAVVRAEGPLLPVEVASKVNSQSFLAKGYLEELVESKLIMQGGRIGESALYYVKGQEAKFKERLEALGDVTKTAGQYADKKAAVTPEVAKKRAAFEDRLKDIEKQAVREKVSKPMPIKRIHSKTVAEVKVIPKKPAMQVAKSFIKSAVAAVKPGGTEISKKSSSEATASAFVDTALEYIKEKGLDIINTGDKISATEAELVVAVPSTVGPVKFFVKIKSKKKINKSDLTLIYAQAIEKHLPAILLTDGELAKTAKKYMKELGGLIRVKQF